MKLGVLKNRLEGKILYRDTIAIFFTNHNFNVKIWIVSKTLKFLAEMSICPKIKIENLPDMWLVVL